MSFIHDVNPFNNILCAPYWDIWILIIISWILAALEIFFLSLTEKYRQRLSGNIKQKVSAHNLLEIEKHLESISIDKEELPSEIISEIMAMLGTESENWQYSKYAINKWKKRKRKQFGLCIIDCSYATFRFFANFANFVIIIMRYLQWYDDNLNASSWRKYCAFIVALLYLPNFKGRALMRLCNLKLFFGEDDTLWMRVRQLVYGINVFMDVLLALVFVLIALPFLIPGTFVFIPTSFMTLIVAGCVWCCVYGILVCLEKESDDEELEGVVVATVLISTFEGHWMYILSLLSMMELFDGSGWVNSYSMAFLGEYCSEGSAFQMSKWSEYPMDIKFLIISWFLF